MTGGITAVGLLIGGLVFIGVVTEIANVGDGTTGHFMLSGSWNPDWQFAHVARALRAGDGSTFTIDLLDAATSPPSPHLTPLATELQRHVAARSIPTDWVTAATSKSPSEGGPSDGMRSLDPQS